MPIGINMEEQKKHEKTCLWCRNFQKIFKMHMKHIREEHGRKNER